MKKMTLANLKRQKGATLLEITLVIALISVITLGALSFYKITSDDSRINEAVTNLGVLTGKIQTIYRNDYTQVTISTIVKSQAVPKSMINSGSDTTLRTAWNSDGVRLTAEQVSSFVGDGFGIQFLSLPDSDCIKLASITVDKYTKLTVNGTTVFDVSPGVSVNTGVNGISTACSNSDNNSVKWISR